MKPYKVEIGGGDLDVFVDGQLILHIGQVSDNEVVHLFLYPQGDLIKADHVLGGLTHELIVARKPKKES